MEADSFHAGRRTDKQTDSLDEAQFCEGAQNVTNQQFIIVEE